MSDKIELNGTVTKECGNGLFTIEVPGINGSSSVVHCRLSGKMKEFNIKIVTGDRVKIEVTPYDLTKGRITYREKS